MSVITALEAALHTQSYSITSSRQAVFDALKNQEPRSMAELVRACPDIDRASVYRTVSLFERLGIVQRLHTGWKYKIELTDTFHEHHHHATCVLCDQSFVVPEDTVIEQHLERLAKSIGFTLESHQLELRGHCPACQDLLKD